MRKDCFQNLYPLQHSRARKDFKVVFKIKGMNRIMLHELFMLEL